MNLMFESSYQDDVNAFSRLMLHKLQKNSHKGKWEKGDLAVYFNRLRGECDELDDEVRRIILNRDGDPMKVALEAADVANYALMIASIALREANMDLVNLGDIE